MKIWLPYTEGGSGTDIFTRSLAGAFNDLGVEAHQSQYSRVFQYAPGFLRLAKAPISDPITIANSWTAYPFSASSKKMIIVVHLCVHDPAYAPFRTKAQAIFHNFFVRRHEARSFRRADRIVAVSQATADAVSRTFDGVKPVVIKNGINTKFFTPAPDHAIELGRQGRPFRLLFVGNPTLRKGADLLAPIMKRLGPQFELRVTAGKQSRRISEIENIHNIGTLNTEEVRQAYRWADALLFPTRMEGLPLAAMEAMSCGTPVIGSNRTSMPEVVEDGVSGLLGDTDPDVIADLVRIAASDQGNWKKMGIASRKRVLDLFDQKRMAREYLDLVKKIAVS